MSMQDFYTRKQASEGIKFPLAYPDGTESEHWLQVRGIDSDEFRMAENEAKRKAVDIASIDDAQKRAENVREVEIECVASLIAGWSFEEKPTKQNIVNFLREAPHIADAVNKLAVKRGMFFKKKSNNSTSGQKQRSSSTKSKKAQKQQ